MNTKFYFLLISCFFAFSAFSFCQTYHFSVSNEPYMDLQGGTPLVNSPWDDPNLTIPIGFNFELFDQTTQTLYLAEADSYLLFSSTLNIVVDFIAFYGADLVDRGFQEDTMLSPITYATTGLAGNRVFTLEWQNAGFFSDLEEFGISTDYVNLQLKLYEASGDIVYHFGPNSVIRPEISYPDEGPFVGLFENYDLDSGIATGEVILLDGDPANPMVVTEYLETYLDGTIPANTVYRFSRANTSLNEAFNSTQKTYYYPNPGIQSITLLPSLRDEITSQVQIINNIGEIIRIDQTTDIIELGGIASGIYGLYFQTVNGWMMQRIFVISEK